MLIGQVVKASGCSRDTIRYYERRGLIAQPTRRDSGYKEYHEHTVGQLRLIRNLQEVGFTLREVGEFVAMQSSGEATCSALGPKLQAHLHAIDERIDTLTRMRSELKSMFTLCDGNSLDDPCGVVDAAMAEKK